MKKLTLIFFLFGVSSSVLAAQITAEVRIGDTKISRIDTYANSSGDLRIEERNFSTSSTMSAAGSASSNDAQVEYHLGKIQEVTLFQSRGEAIVDLDGTVCRKLTADSQAPMGLDAAMGGMKMGDMQKQMADAMAKANAQIAEAMQEARKQGMSAEQEKALNQLINPMMNITDAKPRGTMTARSLGETKTIGKYKAKGYSVVDESGAEKHRIWTVSTRKIDGGKDIRRAMEAMASTYEDYLAKLGGGALMETELTGVLFSEQFKNQYPIKIEDLTTGEITEVIDARSGGDSVDFYPECEVRSMMGN
ncbi:MAG: hypothetical protein AAF465_13845 [Pseudomonadota bacterium]